MTKILKSTKPALRISTSNRKLIFQAPIYEESEKNFSNLNNRWTEVKLVVYKFIFERINKKNNLTSTINTATHIANF